MCVVCYTWYSMCMKRLGAGGLGSLMMRIKELLNCERAKLRETKWATKIRMQNPCTTSMELTYNHSCLQTCTYLHKLWLSAFTKKKKWGDMLPTAQLWPKLPGRKLNRKDTGQRKRGNKRVDRNECRNEGRQAE